MTIDEAKKICGNSSRSHLRMMVKALSLHRWLNTPAESKRLAAAKILLRYNY